MGGQDVGNGEVEGRIGEGADSASLFNNQELSRSGHQSTEPCRPGQSGPRYGVTLSDEPVDTAGRFRCEPAGVACGANPRALMTTLPDLRNAPGTSPKARRNHRFRCALSAKPHSWATCVTVRSLFVSSRLLCWMRSSGEISGRRHVAVRSLTEAVASPGRMRYSVTSFLTI